MLTPDTVVQIKACAFSMKNMSAYFGSHPLAPAACLIAKCLLVLAIGYLVWSDLKWL